MPDIHSYFFSHRELAEVLIKHQGLHEGLWAVGIAIKTQATYACADGSPDSLNPIAAVYIQQIGLVRAMEMNALSVDAAVVNPLPFVPEAPPVVQPVRPPVAQPKKVQAKKR